ncbi:MAG: glycoside hydrolase family 95 protein [Bacteroidaceae bacterium]|nr:glycoside hydrolase family 95 protein [Bacteroidaceae bacterium]
MRIFKNTALILIFAFLSMAQSNAQKGGKLKMWYDKPASNWNEALPLGNGRIAAMVFGNPVKEQVQLNESSFWSGGPSRNDNPDGLKGLDSIRYYIFKGNYARANTLSNKFLTAKQLHGSMFQVIGNLNLAFKNSDSYTDYYRELDLERAITTTIYKVGDVTYKREVFASQPDQVIVVRLTASESGKLSFTANFDSELQKSVKALDAHTLEMTGLSGTHEGVTGQVKFDARAKIITSGGSTTVSSDKINVCNANEVTILISIATNFVDYKTLTANEVEKCTNYLVSAEKKPYSQILKDHIAAFQKYFNRVSFDLGTSPAAHATTDERIRNFSKSVDPELVTMYYQFGRYLLISSSQPGGQPANLQGIWNGSNSPAWDSKYTININTEMNYWPAEKCNLTEMDEPLVQMIKELSESGKETAKVMYGCNGWVAHHNTDIWRITGVVDFADAGQWPMGGAWLSQHLWEKYLYGGDLKYLESVYPVLKSACEFYKDFLIEEPTHKWLVVSPSVSPENTPEGHRSALVAGCTIDNQLLFDLFTKTIKAGKLLKKDPALMADFQKILDRFPPMQIGRLGQLQEWLEDWDNPNDHNRHVSHLYGLFPSNQITPYTTPQLFDAARTSLNYRGDVSTGWSMGWKVNLWARLLDGNHAFKLISDQLTLVDPAKGGFGSGGGTYPNFFDAHPPFQIDGNFGCTSGIIEMLLQSHDGSIDILPALPDDWKNGSITGLKAYGGFEVSFAWKKNKVQKITIKSNLGGNCRIRVPNEVVLTRGKAMKEATGNNSNPFFEIVKVKEPLVSAEAKLNPVALKRTYLYDLPTEVGKVYTIICKKRE